MILYNHFCTENDPSTISFNYILPLYLEHKHVYSVSQYVVLSISISKTDLFSQNRRWN